MTVTIRQCFLIALTVIVVTATFIIDINVQLGFTDGIPYVLAILIAYYVNHKGFIITTAAVSLLLTTIGFYLSPEGGVIMLVLSNRITAMFLICISTSFACRTMRENQRVIESNEEKHLLLDSITEGIYGLDLHGNTTFVNPAMASMLGYIAEELIGQPMHTLVHHSYPDGTVYPLEKCPIIATITDGEIHTVINEVLWRKDGSSFPVEYTSTPIKKNGVLAGAIAIFRDISEHEIKERRKHDRTIIDKAMDGIITINERGGVIVSFNPAAETLFGYSAKEVIGKNVKMLMPEPYHREHEDYLSNYKNTGVKKIIGTGRDVIAQRKDGSTFPVHLWISEAKTNKGHIFTGIVRDLSERKKIEKHLHQSKKEDEDANKAKSHFLANMSHEIRTPMNGVLGMLELLEYTSMDTDQKDLVNTANTAAKSMLRLINDILDFSKIEAGELSLEHMPFDLHKVIGDSIAVQAIQASKKGLEVNCFVHPDLPNVLSGDPERLRQVLTNLINNAIKFTSEGEISVNVNLEEEAEEHFLLRFEIKDSGIGISAEKQEGERLFDAYIQEDVSTTRKFGGTGLGLSISKQLVEMMGGEIGVDSVKGQGATFWFTAEFGKTDKPS